MEFILRQKQWAIPLVLSVLALGLQLGELDVSLRYEREGIQQGEWWLLITGNIVHLGWGHVALNLMGLFMVWWFFISDFNNLEWLWILTVSGLFVTVGLYLFNPQLIWYVGLSGVLHGLFFAGGLRLLKKEFGFAATLLVFIAAKLIYEQLVGSLPGTSEMSGGPVVVDSHLYGAIGGVVGLILLQSFETLRRKYSNLNHSVEP